LARGGIIPPALGASAPFGAILIWEGIAVVLSRRKIGSVMVSGVTLGMLLFPGTGSSKTVAPTDCQDVKSTFSKAPDGQYLILAASTKLMSVYCHDMAHNPRDYINLGQTGRFSNFSQYTAGGSATGTTVRTSFRKIRFNPTTSQVDIGDLTFASSEGSLRHPDTQSQVKSMPYGAAMSCDMNNSGVGNIDLTGTPFGVADTFTVGGYRPDGSATVSPGGKVVQLNGRGFCGWITSTPYVFNPFNPKPGDFQLELKCTGVLGTLGVCL
jgi:hypothetical protein